MLCTSARPSHVSIRTGTREYINLKDYQSVVKYLCILEMSAVQLTKCHNLENMPMDDELISGS